MPFSPALARYDRRRAALVPPLPHELGERVPRIARGDVTLIYRWNARRSGAFLAKWLGDVVPGCAQVGAPFTIRRQPMIGKTVSHYRSCRTDRSRRHGCRLQSRGYTARAARSPQVSAGGFFKGAIRARWSVSVGKRGPRRRSTNPNICTVYDIDEHEDQPFIAMEFMKGPHLEGPY